MRHNKDGDRNLFNLFGRFSLVLVISFGTLNAQGSFENFKRHQSRSFQKYKDEKDSIFKSYLMQEWKAFSAQEPTPMYEEPKPLRIDPAPFRTQKAVGPKISIKLPQAADDNDTSQKEQNLSKKIIVLNIPQEKKKDVAFDFYGSFLSFNVSQEIKKADFYPPDQSGIVSFFNTAASNEYASLVSDIKKVSKDMNLNDWGVYLLVLKISNEIFKNEDNSKLFSWFLFNKLGYAVKIALANKHVILLHYSQKIIYDTPSYILGSKSYYAVSDYAKNIRRVFSYVKDYPGSSKPLDLLLHTLPKFKPDIRNKDLSFTQSDKNYILPVIYNKNLLDFMATYPQADYDTFFNAPLDEITYSALASSIKEMIGGKKASEAINFLLGLVQKSFKYEQDDKQFGREKVMFAQETLFFDRSDCEDRAILFSQLIKKILGINVIGVKYKDHMATALYIPMQGDSVKAYNKKFIIADPTYINASVGMSMPKYKFVRPQSYILVKID